MGDVENAERQWIIFKKKKKEKKNMVWPAMLRVQ